MLRSPQHLVLQLSCRRTLSTATTSSSSPPPPPSGPPFHPNDPGPPPPASSAAVASAAIPVFPVSPLSSLTPAPPVSIRSSTSTAATGSAAVRPVRMSTDSAVAGRQRRSPSEERPSSRASSTDAPVQSRFPLGYKEAVHQWWECHSPMDAEHNVLSFLPYIRQAKTDAHADPDHSGVARGNQQRTADDPYGHRVWRSQMVPLSGKNRALNEFSIERVGEETTDTLVILHGYGAGLGFFYRNFEPLSRFSGWRLYALDLLGMGNSSRPPFKIHAKDPQAKITEAENWFIDALEEWRRIRRVERLTLMGHSMGGYLAVAYALKYPGHVNKLILASPVGVPEDPYAVNADMPEPQESSLATEFAQDQNAVVEGYSEDAPAVAAAAANAPAPQPVSRQATSSSTKPQRRPLPGWLVWLWDANVSPFSLIRASGPLGPRLVSAWTSRRFSHLQPDQAEALHRYTYSLFRQRGSGEYVLPYVLAPGAHARRPLIHRIQNVGRQVIRPAQAATATSPAKAQVREAGVPIVMLYGDHDWMDVTGGFAAQEKIKARTVQALLHGTADERQRENGSAKVIVVRNAGHHLYLDNAEEFNAYVQKELQDTQESERRLRRQLAECLA